jgi:hypothetical protein
MRNGCRTDEKNERKRERKQERVQETNEETYFIKRKTEKEAERVNTL